MTAVGSGGVGYRSMADADLDEVATIEALVSPLPWSRELLGNELTLPGDANHWRVAIDESAEPADTVIGFGGVMVVADETHVMNIAVHPSHRRRGIGRRLLQQLLAAGRRRGAVAATLEVRSTNEAAIALYTDFGFRPAGRRPGYYGDDVDALIMRKQDLVGGPS